MMDLIDEVLVDETRVPGRDCLQPQEGLSAAALDLFCRQEGIIVDSLEMSKAPGTAGQYGFLVRWLRGLALRRRYLSGCAVGAGDRSLRQAHRCCG